MPLPLRVILHFFQVLFLLFTLLIFAIFLVHSFDASNVVWDAEYESAVAAGTLSALLTIAFSPGLWSVAKNGSAVAGGGSAQPVGQVPPPTGQVPPPAGQAPPPPAGHAPPGVYGQ